MFHRTESLDFGIVMNGEIVWYVAHPGQGARDAVMTVIF